MKNYDTRKIRSRKSYSTEQISQLLGAHIQTVRQWQQKGMQSIQGSKSPYLFLGKEVKNYLQGRKKKLGRKLGPLEFYCLSCRKSVKGKNIKSKDRGITIGHDERSLRLHATCSMCNKTVSKFSSARIENECKSEPSSDQNKKQKGTRQELIDDNFTLFDEMEQHGIN